jgi:hypothetical protein
MLPRRRLSTLGCFDFFCPPDTRTMTGASVRFLYVDEVGRPQGLSEP